ncbi:hypothetical protein CS022_10835 [Veronia nyctiphanis]|uniref:Uncharacterized protein n=2 Tax=Veronia nyctiphanis TaxID=1278244 RepID=A0A4Q0YW51_9GAMM|nr:hypothetical protein CS022_10835 [Veronia nyctiphanis]
MTNKIPFIKSKPPIKFEATRINRGQRMMFTKGTYEFFLMHMSSIEALMASNTMKMPINHPQDWLNTFV